MRFPMKFLVLLAACLTAVAASAQEGEPAAIPRTLEALQSAIADIIEDENVPAAGVALVDADGPVWVGALGMANLENGIQADENTMFRIGSTSKIFVALAVLKLVEEGRLSLDDRVRDLAPDVVFKNRWEQTDPVRVVHLLEHTTGWDDIHLPEYAHNDPAPATLKEALDYHPHSRQSRWIPGSRMSYCNSGPPVAAYIVEQVTGQDFEDYVRINFFEPMGMETMTYRLTEDVEAHGATLYANGKHPLKYWHIIMRPSGSINASAADMARLLAFFINRGAVNGRQLVSKGSLSRMETPHSTPAAQAGQESGYGLNNYTSVHEQWVFHGHNGGVNGGLTELAYLPEANRGHAIMINTDNGDAIRKIIRVVRAYETHALTARSVQAGREPSPANQEVEGYYYPINPRQQAGYFIERISEIQKLWFDQGQLRRKRLLGGAESAYYPVSDTLYKSAKTGQVSLSRVSDPIAGDVVHAGTLVLKPVSALIVFPQLGIAALWAILLASTLLFLPVWLIRKLMGKIPQNAAIRVRLWPLLASVSVLLVGGLFLLGLHDPFMRLGAPTVYSLGILLATLAFAVFTLLGVQCAASARDCGINRATWWHSALTTGVHLLVLVYLLSFGVIGLMTWA